MSTTDEGNSPNKLSLSFLLCEGNSAKQKESTPGNPDSGSQPSGGYQNSEDSQLSPPSISQSPSVSPSSSTTPSPTSRPIRDSRGHSPPIELAADLARRTSSVMSYHPESGVVSHPDEIGGPSQWLDNTDKLLDQIRVFTQHPGLKLEHMADLQMFLFQHNATREQHHDPILATTPVTEPSSSTSNGTGRRRRGSRQALHTASVNPSQSGMFVGADLHRQIEQYGAKLFAKDRDGNYECFFEYCNKKMANNFSRHIYGV
ncbi:hypothetical protein Pelo_1612 [Pelomyxa schiedti]|nr:hypothetical protein Pelo_1612 [Pelomyxa schiedti]